MASDLNKAILIGRLTRDPELKYTSGGTSVSSFSIACNYTYVSGGQKKEQVSFFNCVAWSKLGEVIAEYCKKGHRIAIVGRLQQRSWDDQEGKKRQTVEIVVDNCQFLNAVKSESAPAAKKENAPQPSLEFPEGENPFSDEDIPF